MKHWISSIKLQNFGGIDSFEAIFNPMETGCMETCVYGPLGSGKSSFATSLALLKVLASGFDIRFSRRNFINLFSAECTVSYSFVLTLQETSFLVTYQVKLKNKGSFAGVIAKETLSFESATTPYKSLSIIYGKYASLAADQKTLQEYDRHVEGHTSFLFHEAYLQYLAQIDDVGHQVLRCLRERIITHLHVVLSDDIFAPVYHNASPCLDSQRFFELPFSRNEFDIDPHDIVFYEGVAARIKAFLQGIGFDIDIELHFGRLRFDGSRELLRMVTYRGICAEMEYVPSEIKHLIDFAQGYVEASLVADEWFVVDDVDAERAHGIYPILLKDRSSRAASQTIYCTSSRRFIKDVGSPHLVCLGKLEQQKQGVVPTKDVYASIKARDYIAFKDHRIACKEAKQFENTKYEAIIVEEAELCD